MKDFFTIDIKKETKKLASILKVTKKPKVVAEGWFIHIFFLSKKKITRKN